MFNDLTGLASTVSNVTAQLQVQYGYVGAAQSSFFGSSVYSGAAGVAATVYVQLAPCFQGCNKDAACNCVDGARAPGPSARPSGERIS